MAKAARTAALVVGAVALTVATAGTFAPVATASFLGAAGITAGTVAATTALATTLSLVATGLSAGAMLATKKPKVASTATGSQSALTIARDAGIPYVMGRTSVAGTLVHRMTWDDTGNTNRYLTYFGTWSGGGPIQEIEAIKVNREVVEFDEDRATGLYAGYMYLQRQLGACPEPQALIATGSLLYPDGWSAASKMSGHAAFAWTLLFDKEGKRYTTGVPTLQAVLKGVKVYDPRADSTYPGGSGACRALEEDTYVYSTNPALHGLTWALGRWQNGKLVLGVGAPPDGIDIRAFVEAANVADANGWAIGGEILSSDDKWGCLKLILQAGGAEPIRIGALISCAVSAPRVSLATVTADQLAGTVRAPGTQPRRDRINSVIPRYRSEEHDFGVVSAEKLVVGTYLTEDGAPRTREFEMPLVPDKDQAAELGLYEVCNSREFGPLTVPLKPKWIGFRPGDCITLNIPDANLVDQPAIIINRSLDASTGIVTLTLKSETAAKHDFALGRTGVAPPTPGLQIVDPTLLPLPGFNADWTGIVDDDPVNHPKPEDGATVGMTVDEAAAVAAAQAAIAAAEALIAEIQSSVDVDIPDLKARVLAAEGEILTLNTGIATANSGISSLWTAVTNAEGDLADIEVRVGAAETTIVTNTTAIASQGTQVATVTSDLATANANISLNTTAITTLTGNQASLASTVSSQGSAIASLSSATTALSGTVATITSTIRAGSSNLLIGGDWSADLQGWELSPFINRAFYNKGVGRFLDTNNPTGTTGFVFKATAYPEADYYTLSFEGVTSFGVGAYFLVQVMNADQTIAYETASVAVGGTWDARLSATVPPVSNPAAAIIRAVLVLPPGTGASFTRVMIQRGQYATSWRDEATVRQTQSVLSTLGTQYAALSATVATQGATVSIHAASISTLESGYGTLTSTVATQGGYITAALSSITTLEGYTSTRFVVTAVSGGRAQLSIFSNSNGGGGVDIVGDVAIHGNLVVDGTITFGKIGANAASLPVTALTVGTVTPGTSWTDIQSASIATVGGQVTINMGFFSFFQTLDPDENEYQLLRDGVVIFGPVSMNRSAGLNTTGTQFRYNFKWNNPAAFMDGPAPGAHTYTLQARRGSVSTDFCSVYYRVINLLESRR